MKKHIYSFLTFVLVLCSITGVMAQTPTYVNGVLPANPGGNSIPFSFGGTSQVSQLLFPAGSFGTVPSGQGINRIYFAAYQPITPVQTTYTGFTIKIGNTTATNLTGTLVAPLTTAINNAASYTINPQASPWFSISWPTPILFNPSQSLVVEISYCGRTQASTWFLATGAPGGTQWRSFGSTTCTSTTNPSSGSGTNYYFGFDLAPLTPPAPPVANFFLPATGCQFTPTTLINNSQGNSPTARYKWTFTPSTVTYLGGTNDSSIRPMVSFNDSVSYDVKLRVTNALGADSITKTIAIRGSSVVPVADFFTGQRIVPEATYISRFTDLTTECPSSWAWSSPDYEQEFFMSPFLDSTRQNGEAFFAFSGTFDICLRATNGIGSHTTCKQNYITVLPADNLCNDTMSTQPAGFIMDEGTATSNYQNNRTLSNCKGYLIDPCAASVTLTFEQIKLAIGAGDSIFVHNGVNQNADRKSVV